VLYVPLELIDEVAVLVFDTDALTEELAVLVSVVVPVTDKEPVCVYELDDVTEDVAVLVAVAVELTEVLAVLV
jgi:hypothetical protein